MPRATLTFTLPDEQTEYEHASHGADWYLIVWDLDEWLRHRSKYLGHETVRIDELRKWIAEQCDEYGVAL